MFSIDLLLLIPTLLIVIKTLEVEDLTLDT